jgi:transposase
MARSKFVNPLTETTKQQLREIYVNDPCFRKRCRAHAMLLSNEGNTITQLQAIFQIGRDMISRWIDRFNEKGIAGLADLPRSGRPTIYNEMEIKTFQGLVEEEPRQIKKAQALLELQTGKKSSTKTLKRILKN